MKRAHLYQLIAAVLLYACSPVSARDSALVARIAFFQAKPGAKSQMEAAIKKQMDWRRSQGDEWRWLAWEYASGGGGQYALATFAHGWQEFDQVKVSPMVEEVEQEALSGLSATPPVIHYYDHLEEVSAAGAASESPTLAEVTVFQVQFGKTAAFYDGLRQFHAAMQKSGAPARYEWFELLSGGEAPQFMLFLPRRDWAALDTQGGALLGALEKAVGPKKAKAVFDGFTATVKTSQRWIIRLRPDLSLLQVPPAQKAP